MARKRLYSFTHQHAGEKGTFNTELGYLLCIFKGIKAKKLALSDGLVWALTTNANTLVCRVGISDDVPTGECWKRVPYAIDHISGTI